MKIEDGKCVRYMFSARSRKLSDDEYAALPANPWASQPVAAEAAHAQQDAAPAVSILRSAPASAQSADLLDAAECLLEVLDGYHEQLVPINRKSVTVNWLRKAVAQAGAQPDRGAAHEVCHWCDGEGVDGEPGDEPGTGSTWKCGSCNGTGRKPVPVAPSDAKGKADATNAGVLRTVDEEVERTSAMDRAFPITDNPHTSVQQRTMQNRVAFGLGWDAKDAALIEAVRMDIIDFLRASMDDDCANRVEEFMTAQVIARNIEFAAMATAPSSK